MFLKAFVLYCYLHWWKEAKGGETVKEHQREEVVVGSLLFVLEC